MLAPSLADRFRADLEALTPTPARLGIAFSGGPDSLALLLLARAAHGDRVAAATVDHGLRAEAAAEAARAAALCAGLAVPHIILTVTVPDGPDGVQAEARAARYTALRRWAEGERIPLLLTAHHQDDQAETLLMRLQRGAGLAGLSGIRPLRPLGANVTLARPLLGWTRAELAAIVRDAGLAPVDDPSNRDSRFDRTAIRAFLAAYPRFEPPRLARTAAALREADEALAWQADRLWEERAATADGEVRLDTAGLPRALKRRLLGRAIGAVRAGLDPLWSGAEDVESLLRTLEAGGTATRAGVRAEGGALWRFCPAPPRRR